MNYTQGEKIKGSSVLVGSPRCTSQLCGANLRRNCNEFAIHDGKMSSVFDLRKLDLPIHSNCRIRILKGESE